MNNEHINSDKQEIEQFQARFIEYHKLYDETIGTIINLHVEFESLMEEIIVQYFFKDPEDNTSAIPDKIQLFRKMFICNNRFGLSAKNRVLKEIMRLSHYSEKDTKELDRAIIEINDFRNILAHYQIYWNWNVIDHKNIDKIIFQRGHGEYTETKIFTRIELDAKLKLCRDILNILMDFRYHHMD